MIAKAICYKYLLIREEDGHYLESENISERLKRRDLDIIKETVENYKNLHEKDSQRISITGLGEKKPTIIQIERILLIDNRNEKGLKSRLVPLNSVMKVD